MAKREKFEEFDVVVRVRGVGLDQTKAADLIEAILSREMDHNGDDWGETNKMSFMVPGSTPLPPESNHEPHSFYPGDDHYGRE